MRLLIHSTEFPPGPGGIGTQAWELARNLSLLGWDVCAVAPQDYATEQEIIAFNSASPFRVVRVPRARGRAKNILDRMRSLFQVMANWSPDAVIATGDRAVYGSAFASRRYTCPWLAVEHGRLPHGWEMAAKKWAVRRASALISVSRYTRDEVRKNGIRARCYEVIENGADATRFSVWNPARIAHARRELRLPSGHLLLTVGNVTPRKGQDTVIRSLPLVLRRFPDAHYLIAGLPSCRQEFESLAQRLGVGDHVHFLGRVEAEQTVGLMNCCDLFLMTSRRVSSDFEGYGIAAVEAALCGKPSIVSNNCGLVEAVLHQVTGLTVAESDEVDTAKAITSLLGDAERRLALGQAARCRAAKHQTWESVAAAYHQLLTGMISAGEDRPTTLSGQSVAVR
jgi:phosphatidyl-myo-inositol dimannoside synthase